MTYRYWTNKELAYVREHYPRDGAKKVGIALGRPAGSVSEFARRHGVKCLNQVGGTYTMAAVQARCEIDSSDSDACWLWTGRMRGSIPQAWHNGSLVSMRRVVFGLHAAREAKASDVVQMTCECDRCLNPLHMIARPRASLLKENMASEPPIRRTARLRAAAEERGQAVLDMDAARAIRASSESSMALAGRYGVTQTTINRVRRGVSWRDYSAAGAGRLAT